MSKFTPRPRQDDADSTHLAPSSPVIRSRTTAGALFAAYVVVVGFIVFWPTADVASHSVLGIWSLLQSVGAPAWISTWAVEFVTNAVMFMPLSIIGNTFRPQWVWRHWLGAGLAGSLAIEAFQWSFLPGRTFQLADLASNTLGALVGYGLVVLVRRLRKPVSSSADQAR